MSSEITIKILYIYPLFCGFKAFIFGLLTCHTVWRLIHITSKISSDHDGTKDVTKSIFDFLTTSRFIGTKMLLKPLQ